MRATLRSRRLGWVTDREPESSSESVSWWQALAAVLVFVALAFGSWQLVEAIDPGRVTVPKDPGFLELLVADRTVLTFLRIAVILGLSYVIWSVVQLISTGRFLTSLPGVSVSDAAEKLRQAGEQAAEEQKGLEAALADANRDIGALLEYVEELQADLAMYEDGDEDKGDGDAKDAPIG